MPHNITLADGREAMREQEAVVYSAYVGIDWENSKHDVCVQQTDSDKRQFRKVSTSYGQSFQR